MELGVGTKASEKQPIQVVPICAISGVVPPAMAVWYLLCAASQGIAVTLTVTPGFAASNCLAKAGRPSPSSAWAQMFSVPVAGPVAMVLAALAADSPVLLAVSLRPQAVSTSAAANSTAAAGLALIRNIDVPLLESRLSTGVGQRLHAGCGRDRRSMRFTPLRY